MTRVQALSLAVAGVFGAAMLATHLTHHVCRIVVVDVDGNQWIAGQGDSLAAAKEGAQLPPLPVRSIAFPGCYR